MKRGLKDEDGLRDEEGKGLRDEKQNSDVRLRTKYKWLRLRYNGKLTSICHCVFGFHKSRVTDGKLFEKSPLWIQAVRDNTANTNLSKTCDISLTLPSEHTALHVVCLCWQPTVC